ncbi:patatin-like phospholipase family protein [Yimella sp. cx-51]|uniref:patatin-like phospholipase family protein n=1 Tax=Yimella sp. cx-51 TaxID=2770551 RepID=UPI00165E5344|nr:patatin-like phospholipase family protein [Yimella sp. cx-51]MBC9956984.1 patatin-like phospholipase family protein [Yimella sp. cx-51]QTH39199.1 patatin-like phospholipase family protein [Yimella sp. cx-51]
MTSTPRTAFVLGGGGVLGATQIGALRALAERGIRPDLVLGTSIGAINGAAFAARPDGSGLTDLEDLWTHLTTIRGLRERSGYLRRPQAAGLRTHLYPSGGILQLLRDELPVQQIEELEIRFQCVAASVEQAKARWFTTGPLAEAVVASCSVPGLFPPFRIGDEHFLDGGLVHSIPVGRAMLLGCERIYVMHVGRVDQPLRPPRWPWQVAQVAFEIARRHRYLEEIESVPDEVELIVLPTGTSDAPSVSLGQLNRGAVRRRIDNAYDAASVHLDQTALQKGSPR